MVAISLNGYDCVSFAEASFGRRQALKEAKVKEVKVKKGSQVKAEVDTGRLKSGVL